jgi:hypothetical protein
LEGTTGSYLDSVITLYLPSIFADRFQRYTLTIFPGSSILEEAPGLETAGTKEDSLTDRKKINTCKKRNPILTYVGYPDAVS